MAISPTDANDVFIREVDDAVREDQIKSFWDRYGKALLGLIAVGVVGYGGYLYYNHSKAQDTGVTSENFYRALDAAQAGNIAQSDKELAAVAKEGDPAYQAAAIMVQASNAMQQNDVPKAAGLYAQVAADTKTPQMYRDLALVRQMTLLFDKEKPETIVARINPIATPDHPFYASAAELVALANMKMGKEAEAAKIFGQIAATESVPDDLKTRAQQMASMLGSGSTKATGEAAPAPKAGESKAPAAQTPATKMPENKTPENKTPENKTTVAGEAK